MTCAETIPVSPPPIKPNKWLQFDDQALRAILARRSGLPPACFGLMSRAALLAKMEAWAL